MKPVDKRLLIASLILNALLILFFCFVPVNAQEISTTTPYYQTWNDGEIASQNPFWLTLFLGLEFIKFFSWFVAIMIIFYFLSPLWNWKKWWRD